MWYAHQLDRMQLVGGEAVLTLANDDRAEIILRNVQQADTFRTAVENRYIYTISKDGSIS